MHSAITNIVASNETATKVNANYKPQIICTGIHFRSHGNAVNNIM